MGKSIIEIQGHLHFMQQPFYTIPHFQLVRFWGLLHLSENNKVKNIWTLIYSTKVLKVMYCCLLSSLFYFFAQQQPSFKWNMCVKNVYTSCCLQLFRLRRNWIWSDSTIHAKANMHITSYFTKKLIILFELAANSVWNKAACHYQHNGFTCGDKTWGNLEWDNTKSEAYLTDKAGTALASLMHDTDAKK